MRQLPDHGVSGLAPQPQHQQTNAEYDSLGRTVAETGPEGNVAKAVVTGAAGPVEGWFSGSSYLRWGQWDTPGR